MAALQQVGREYLLPRLRFYHQRFQDGVEAPIPEKYSWRMYYQSLGADGLPIIPPPDEDDSSSEEEDDDPLYSCTWSQKDSLPNQLETVTMILTHFLADEFTAGFVKIVTGSFDPLCIKKPDDCTIPTSSSYIMLSELARTIWTDLKIFLLARDHPEKAKVMGEVVMRWGKLIYNEELFDQLFEIGVTDEQIMNLAQVCEPTDYVINEDADPGHGYGRDLLSAIIPRSEFRDETVIALIQSRRYPENDLIRVSVGNLEDELCDGELYTKVSLIYRYRPQLIDHPGAANVIKSSSLFQYLNFPLTCEVTHERPSYGASKEEKEASQKLLEENRARAREKTHQQRIDDGDYYVLDYDIIHYWCFRAKRNYSMTGKLMDDQIHQYLKGELQKGRFYPVRTVMITILLQDPETSEAVTNDFIMDLIRPGYFEIGEDDHSSRYSIPSQVDMEEFCHGYLEVNQNINILKHLILQDRMPQATDLLKRAAPFYCTELNERVTKFNSETKDYVDDEKGYWHSKYLIRLFPDAGEEKKTQIREFLRALLRIPCAINKSEIDDLERILEQPLIDVVFPEGWREDPGYNPNFFIGEDSWLFHLLQSYPSPDFSLQLTTHPEFDVSKSQFRLSDWWMGQFKDMPEKKKEFLTRMLQCGYVCSAEEVKKLTALGIDVFKISQDLTAGVMKKQLETKKMLRQMKKREIESDRRYEALMERCDAGEERQLQLLRINQALFHQLQLIGQGWEQARAFIKAQGGELPDLPQISAPAGLLADA